MPIHVRLLTVEDQHLLEDTPTSHFDLHTNTVLGAFNDVGELVGTMGVVGLPHVEGTWVREDSRSGVVLRRLETAVLEHVREQYGIDRLFGFSTDDAMADYAARSGWIRKPWVVWEKETK